MLAKIVISIKEDAPHKKKGERKDKPRANTAQDLTWNATPNIKMAIAYGALLGIIHGLIIIILGMILWTRAPANQLEECEKLTNEEEETRV